MICSDRTSRVYLALLHYAHKTFRLSFFKTFSHYTQIAGGYIFLYSRAKFRGMSDATTKAKQQVDKLTADLSRL